MSRLGFDVSYSHIFTVVVVVESEFAREAAFLAVADQVIDWQRHFWPLFSLLLLSFLPLPFLHHLPFSKRDFSNWKNYIDKVVFSKKKITKV